MTDELKVYRVFCMDSVGKITATESVEASSDDQAVKRVRALNLGTHCEIWDRQRLVARITKEPVASSG